MYVAFRDTAATRILLALNVRESESRNHRESLQHGFFNLFQFTAVESGQVTCATPYGMLVYKPIQAFATHPVNKGPLDVNVPDSDRMLYLGIPDVS